MEWMRRRVGKGLWRRVTNDFRDAAVLIGVEGVVRAFSGDVGQAMTWAGIKLAVAVLAVIVVHGEG